VLITGAASGIGYAMAKNFALAGANRVIITGRSREKIDTAVQSLNHEHDNIHTKFEGVVCQMSEPDNINHMFDKLAADSVIVDVLVLNAALNVAGTLSEQGWEKTWEQFIVNTRSLHQLCDRLHKQNTQEESKVNSFPSLDDFC
jgi:short-subunit dehydrogenase